MNTHRLLLAAAAATLLSTAAFAAPPSASQVAVPAQAEQQQRHGKMQRWFNSPDQFRMFRIEMRQATHGLPRDQKRAYRKAQLQKLRTMTDAQRDQWRHDLQAKWDAMPAAQRQQIAERMDAHAQRWHAHHNKGGQAQDQGAPGPDGDYSDQAPPPPPPPHQYRVARESDNLPFETLPRDSRGSLFSEGI